MFSVCCLCHHLCSILLGTWQRKEHKGRGGLWYDKRIEYKTRQGRGRIRSQLMHLDAESVLLRHVWRMKNTMQYRTVLYSTCVAHLIWVRNGPQSWRMTWDEEWLRYAALQMAEHSLRCRQWPVQVATKRIENQYDAMQGKIRRRSIVDNQKSEEGIWLKKPLTDGLNQHITDDKNKKQSEYTPLLNSHCIARLSVLNLFL